MNRFRNMVGIIAFIISSSTLSAEINLLCTGEEYLPLSGARSPYAFRASINTELKSFNINVERDAYPKKEEYPKENPWNKENCTNPIWNLDITETAIRVITGCSKSLYAETGGMIWEILRTDGTFTLYLWGKERANGKCVKASERAF